MKEKGWTRVLNKMLIFSIFMLTVFTLMVRDAQAAVKVDVEKIEIVGNDVLAAGRSTTYKANVTPSNATNKGVLWSVVPENSGATITAAGALKIDAKCTLNSIEVIATSKDNKEILEKKKVAINSTAIETINVLDDKGDSVLGKTITLYRTKITDNTKIDTIVTPSITWVNKNAIIDYKAYKFISSDENLVTVDQEGHIQVTGNTTGKATIKCQAIDGTKDGNGKLLTKSFIVKVIEPVEHIEITGNELVGGLNSVKYTASAFPASATNKKLVWSVYPENKGVNISKTGVLSVTKDCQIDSVNVIAKADEDSAVYTTKKVAINKAGIKAINFDDNNGNRVGKTINLYRVKVTEETPVDYKLNANITWKMDGVTGKNCPYVFSSSDERIATVDQSGYVVVTGEMTGKCTIKCVAIDGSKNQNGVVIQKSVEINVTNPLSKLELSIPDGRSKYVAKGSAIKLAVKKIADYGATPAKTLKFTSSNVSVATVDGNGVVTFKADSYSPVTITATVNDDTKVSGSIELIATNVIKNIQLGYIPSDRANTNKISMLEVSDAPIEFPLTFNAPDQASASIKAVCPEFTVTSNMPEYIEASFENGIVKLWPKKEILNKNVEIIIKPKDGTKFSAKWLFRVEMPEELILEEYDVSTLLKNSVIIDVFNDEDETVVIEEIEDETSENIPSDAESDSEELTDEYREDESIEEETGDMD
ncbi:Ig-like domain (group 2) [Pseudobutyrivibrio sp. OR37]|uniref:Ig-like domain-containing protein n=1 Tax=Pseudobutyrivibrio sp. OR37 TaxID=1798186 RepID=UPI0008EC758C|nr:Ig-like domain-containing protein [Pseudobutyrivibrio sp. OR37]SFH57138.1 Ig-like domain (group 2) [Pseudobutyrivibrio sp. OR37]